MATLTREELHARVWKEPLRHLAPTLGVSDTWLKKCCHAASIPLPDQSYWGKVRAGKQPPITRLPPRPPGVPQTVVFGKEPYRSSWPYDPDKELAEPEPVPPDFPEPIDAVEARVRQRVGRVAYVRDLATPHPLIRHLLAEDEKRRLKPQGIPYRLQYTDPLFASGFEQRRLKLLNSLFLGLAKAGYKAWLNDEEGRGTGVVVGGSQVSFLLDHPKAARDRDYRYRTRPGPADTLQLKLAGDKIWTDDKATKLESHLAEMVVQMIVAGESQLRSGEEHAYRSAIEHRRKMAELKRERQAEAELQARKAREAAERKRRNGLLRLARDRRRASEIRDLVAEVLVNAEDSSDAAGAQAWADWALAVADRTDPLLRMTFTPDGRCELAAADLPAPVDHVLDAG